MKALTITIGLLLIIGAIATLILRRSSINYQFIRNWKAKHSVMMIAGGMFLIFINGLFFYSEAGYCYLVQYPTGKQIAELRPGYHLKWWGEVVPWKKVVTVKFVSSEEKQQDNQTYSGNRTTIPVRFNDAVKADLALSARFRLPEDPELFLKMALEFRNQENLVNGSLIPSCMEIAKNSARLISAQEYIAGRGGELESAVLDQLEKGMYILDAQEMKPELPDSISALASNRIIENRTLIRYDVNKRRNDDGSIMRKKHPIAEYGIIVSQATVEDVNPEQRFKEMLGKQRDAAAQASIEKERAKQAEYEKQRIIAEGEAEKAKIKVNMEKEQITALITMETEKKREQVNVEKHKLELQSARLKAEEVKVLADAEAYKKHKVMEADGALEMKLQTFEKVHSAYAQAIAGTQLVPTTYIGGSDQKGTPSAMDFINIATANMAKDLDVKIKSKK
ncbi:SPFH domain-containing protein [Fulvivirga imtechensis]|nr:SPFH domain-containing protein [Fulvivirga imtechensis]